MLYFLYGKNMDGARAKALELVSVMQKRKPDAELFKIDQDNWSEGRFEEFLGSQGLFERKFIVLASRIFENKEIKDFVIEKLDLLKNSENVFIFINEVVDKKTLDAVGKFADKVQSFEGKEEKKVEPFNTFALADALGERNRKKLWVIYEKAIRSGATPEEISGILFWQIKNMIISSETKNATESGLNPFVFNKALRYAKNFSDNDLSKFAQELVSIYHDAHRGEVDFISRLERFILSV
jgi:DNA polymerase III delta subunit